MFGQDLSDANLFRRVKRGDARAFDALLRRYDPMYRRLVTQLLAEPQQVDDILHKAYVKVWRGAPVARLPNSKDAVASWIYRVVYNVCVDELRRQPPLPLATSPSGPRVRLPAAPVERRLAGLRALPPAERTCLVLVDGQGFSVPAAASVLQHNPASIARQLDEARRRWRDLVIGPPPAGSSEERVVTQALAAGAEGDDDEDGEDGEDAATDGEDGEDGEDAATDGEREAPNNGKDAGTGEGEPEPQKPAAPRHRLSPDINNPEGVLHAPEGAFDEGRFTTLKEWFKRTSETGGGDPGR